ncbi:hypothetical protein SDC9_72656 [bioreactor metagenome]|uniref:NAD-specific glutamate dehydrogenase n=1 Tax=bioreactor metagenome TaxID=1076179 RepID=A0A644YC69_9ZZZZ
MDGEQRLLVQRVNGILLEDLLQEHLAQCGGKLIDQTADAEVFIVDDVFLRVKDLAHLNGDLRLLIGLGQITQMGCHGADAHHGGGLAAHLKRLLNGGRNLVQLADAGPLGKLADQNHVSLAHGENKIVLPVRIQGLNRVRGDGLGLFQGANDKHAPGHVAGNPQFLGPHINVAQHDIVCDDILDKGATVVLLLVIGLGGIQRHGGKGADCFADLVVAEGKRGIVKLRPPAIQRLERLSGGNHHAPPCGIDRGDKLRPPLSDHGKLAARDDDSLAVDHTHRPVRVLLELQDYILKNSSRHCRPS